MQHYEKEFIEYAIEYLEKNWLWIKKDGERINEFTKEFNIPKSKQKFIEKMKKSINFSVWFLIYFDNYRIEKDTEQFMGRIIKESKTDLSYIIEINKKIYGIFEKYNKKKMEIEYYVKPFKEKTITVYFLENRENETL